MKLLKINNLSHTYQDGNKKKKVLKNVDVEFEKGKFYVILGESGSGKTTLLFLIAGLDKVQDGSIEFKGKTISSIGYTNYRLKYVNIVFQSYNLILYMTAVENIMVALAITKYKAKNKSRKEYAYELLDNVGVDVETSNRVILKLSGGEQQRVAIARSMAGDVSLILADEPSGNLDDETEAKIIELFKKLTKEGKCVIVVTHSKNVANSADIIYEIKNGKLLKK